MMVEEVRMYFVLVVLNFEVGPGGGFGDSGLDVPMQADAGGRVALVLIG